MEKLHTNAAPEGEGRAAVSPHAGTHGTARLNHGATQGTQGLQCRAQGRSVAAVSPPSSLAGSLFFSVRRLELDPGHFGKLPAFLPSRRWGCKARGAWRLMEQPPSQTSHTTPAQHGSQQAGVKMHRWGIHFRNFISGVPSS